MKTIAQLFQSIIPVHQTSFEIKLLNSSLMTQGPAISMSDILYLIECFEGYGPECDGIYLSGIEYLGQFFKVATMKPLSGLVSVKLCLTLHLILYEFQVGDIVSEAMLQYQLPKPHPKDPYTLFIQNYSIYLMKIAQGLKVFYAAKVGQYPPVETYDEGRPPRRIQETEQILETQAQNFQNMRKQNKFSLNNVYFQQYQQERLEKQFTQNPGVINIQSKTLFLFKLHNLVNTAVQILKSVIEILNNLQMQVPSSKDSEETSHLFIEISCVLWNDIMVMYKFTGSEINKLLDSFRSQQIHILVSTQQLYHSIVDITAKIKWIYANKMVFDVQRVVRKPFWFEENKAITQSLQNAVIDLKVHGRMFSPDSLRHSRMEPPTPCSKIQTFSARNSTSHPSNFFGSMKNLPRSPQQEPIRKQAPPSSKGSRQANLFKKFTGGIFEDNDEYLSPRAVNPFESVSSNQKESTAASHPKK